MSRGRHTTTPTERLLIDRGRIQPPGGEPTAVWIEMPPHRGWRDFACSACGCKWDTREDEEPPCGCPFCGAVMR